MKNNLKEQKGITLITLVTAIIILVIVTATIAINVNTSLQISNLTRLQNDIEILNDRVSAYYIEHDELPITEDTYTKTQVEKIVKEVSPNDGDVYYTIDLSKIDNITLNFGQDYSSTSDEKYIINENSHKIYFLHGVTYAGVTYYTVDVEENKDEELISYFPELPNKYQRVTYIESTGTQWIDTGVQLDVSNTVAEFVASPTSGASSYYISGILENGNYYGLNYPGVNNNSTNSRWHCGKTSGTGIIDFSNTKDYSGYTFYKIVYDRKKLIIDDVEMASSSENPSFTLNLYVFARNSNGSVNLISPYKLKSCSIKKNDKLIRNFIPCYRKSDGEIGLYDTVEGKFYTNQGTGKFSMSMLPEEYQQVAYIESTGAQYIDTGVLANNLNEIQATFSITNAALNNSRNYIFGTYSASSKARSQYSYSTERFYGWGAGWTQPSSTTTEDIHELIANKDGFILDGTTEYTPNSTDFTSPKNICLFACNSNGTFNTCSNGVRIWKLDILKDGDLIRNFIPCYRISDMEIGLYDIVEGKFYTNKGTGTFLLPSQQLPSEYLADYREVEYIESTGTQYIETGYYVDKDTSIYADFQFTDLTVQQRLFGVDTGDSGNSNVSYSFYINGSSIWAYSFIDGGGNWIPTNKSADKTRHTLNFNFDSKIKIDNETFYNENISGNISETATTSLPIMAKNNGKGIMRYAKVKIYNFQIYNSNVLVRNFIPCYRKSDNVVGLLDTVEGTFYTNAGTGTFVRGANKY